MGMQDTLKNDYLALSSLFGGQTVSLYRAVSTEESFVAPYSIAHAISEDIERAGPRETRWHFGGPALSAAGLAAILIDDVIRESSGRAWLVEKVVYDPVADSWIADCVETRDPA